MGFKRHIRTIYEWFNHFKVMCDPDYENKFEFVITIGYILHQSTNLQHICPI
jgi:hypothetical protein